MIRCAAISALIGSLVAGCVVMPDAKDECLGGKIVQEKRTTDVVLGRTRNTVMRTNTCLE
jgi:hypothetical protein